MMDIHEQNKLQRISLSQQKHTEYCEQILLKETNNLNVNVPRYNSDKISTDYTITMPTSIHNDKIDNICYTKWTLFEIKDWYC